jgi:hypothetical protein
MGQAPLLSPHVRHRQSPIRNAMPVHALPKGHLSWIRFSLPRRPRGANLMADSLLSIAPI